MKSSADRSMPLGFQKPERHGRSAGAKRAAGQPAFKEGNDSGGAKRAMGRAHIWIVVAALGICSLPLQTITAMAAVV
jgi:hypothetical protein